MEPAILISLIAQFLSISHDRSRRGLAAHGRNHPGNRQNASWSPPACSCSGARPPRGGWSPNRRASRPATSLLPARRRASLMTRGTDGGVNPTANNPSFYLACATIGDDVSRALTAAGRGQLGAILTKDRGPC